MDYSKHYTTLIERSKNRQLEGYKERHHIIPKCMGGSDDFENIAVLTPEEHYVAHLLLAKIYPDVDGLWAACVFMRSGLPGRSNGSYGWVKRNHSKKLPQLMRDGWAKKHSFENYDHQCSVIWKMYVVDGFDTEHIAVLYSVSSTNVRLSLDFYAETRDSLDLLVSATKKKKVIANRKSRLAFTPDQEKRRLDSIRLADYSERDLKMKLDRVGSGNPMFGKKRISRIVMCPHCSKQGAESQMKRWHFDNCKGKK